MLDEGEWIYLIGWSVFSLITAILLFTYRKSTALYTKVYYQFLFKPWKLAVFFIGLGLIAWLGGHNAFNYAVIALLTFITAPWAIGSLQQIITGKRPVYYLIPF